AVALALVAVGVITAGAVSRLGSGDGQAGGSSPPTSSLPTSDDTTPPLSPLATMLQQAGLTECGGPKAPKKTGGEQVRCFNPDPVVSFLGIKLFHDEHWSPLETEYRANLRYYRGKDSNLGWLNSGRCGPRPDQWDHEYAWRFAGPQVNVLFNP